MSAGTSLRVNVVELRRAVGNRRDVSAAVELADVGLAAARVSPGSTIAVDVALEAISGGVGATGRLEASWDGECRRCLEPVSGRIETHVAEVFENRPTEGETYPIEDDHIDLEPMVRELLVLALPIGPLCSPDCPGPVPDRFPVVIDEEGAAAVRDPRWAALDDLVLEVGPIVLGDEPGAAGGH